MISGTTKRNDLLLARLLESIDRLKSLVTLKAPAVIVGNAAWCLLRLTLAYTGEKGGTLIIHDLIKRELSSRGFCESADDCKGDGHVVRPCGFCDACLAEAHADLAAAPGEPAKEGSTWKR